MSLDISAIAYAIRTRLNQASGGQSELGKIKLTHIQECIAAALHHNTLASLQSSRELKAPTDGYYLVLDMGRVRQRAQELGFPQHDDPESAPGPITGFQQIMLECFAKDFSGIEVCVGEDGLYDTFLDWFETSVLNDVNVSGQMAMANHNGLPEVSGADIDLLAIEPSLDAQTQELWVTVRLEPDGERLYTGHVVKVDASLSISKPSHALFGFDLHIGHARLTDGSEDDGQALRQPVDTAPRDEPQRLELALAKLLDVDLARADDLADATLKAEFDVRGSLTGYVFDFKGLELDDDEEERLRCLLPDLTLRVTPAWLDNLLLDQRQKVGGVRNRYYVHGDQRENHAGQYSCKICDAYADVNHFSEHAEANRRRYDEDMRRWRDGPARWKIGLFRPHDPVSLLAEAVTKAKAAREASRSGFHRWLEGQMDREDPVGDFARDAIGDGKFPSSEAKRSELLRYFQRAGVSRGVSAIFLDAWAEYQLYVSEVLRSNRDSKNDQVL